MISFMRYVSGAVNVLYSSKFSEAPMFAGISGFQQNVGFSRFNI